MHYLLMALLIVSCDRPGSNSGVRILGNTHVVNENQDTTTISLGQAKAIFQKYHDENEFKKLETLFYYFQDGYYFFGYHTDPMKDKQRKVWYFLEAKINAETGQLFKLKESIEWQENDRKK